MKIAKIISIAVIVAASALGCMGATPGQVLDKAVANLSDAKGIKAGFNIETKGQNPVEGSFVSDGKMFRLTTPVSTVWYNGTYMWTSNAGTKEITLVKPTAQEIREVNPFEYLQSNKGDYRLFFSKRTDNSRYLVLLNPRKSGSGIKAIEVAINKKTYLPERFIVRDTNDNVVTVNVTSLLLEGDTDRSVYTCPVSEMKGYELVDMR